MAFAKGQLQRAMDGGLEGVALVDRNGVVIAAAGIDEDAAPGLVSLVLYRLKTDDLAERLFGGEIMSLTLDERGDVALCIAKRQLFVLAVMGQTTMAKLELVSELCVSVDAMLRGEEIELPPPSDGSGEGGAPAEAFVWKLPRAKA